MTQEHITITEEVQTKDGLVTQERETIQTTPDPAAVAEGNPAYSVNSPDYVPATELVYTYNEETGMSESAPRPPAETEEPEAETEPEEEVDNTLPAPESEAVEDDETTVHAAFSKLELCGRPVGNGTCGLEAGHAGVHKLEP